jgi:hypothetical protein
MRTTGCVDANAKPTATVVFPVPPFPLAMAMMRGGAGTGDEEAMGSGVQMGMSESAWLGHWVRHLPQPVQFTGSIWAMGVKVMAAERQTAAHFLQPLQRVASTRASRPGTDAERACGVAVGVGWLAGRVSSMGQRWNPA